MYSSCSFYRVQLETICLSKKSITPNNSYINYRIIFKYLISNNLTLIGTPVDL